MEWEAALMVDPKRTVWVYRIPVDVLTASSTTIHRIPEGARFLYAAEQHGQTALWYEIPDPAARKRAHGFQLFGTGTGPIGDHLLYLATTLHAGGDLVLHVYEVADV